VKQSRTDSRTGQWEDQPDKLSGLAVRKHPRPMHRRLYLHQTQRNAGSGAHTVGWLGVRLAPTRQVAGDGRQVMAQDARRIPATRRSDETQPRPSTRDDPRQPFPGHRAVDRLRMPQNDPTLSAMGRKRRHFGAPIEWRADQSRASGIGHSVKCAWKTSRRSETVACETDCGQVPNQRSRPPHSIFEFRSARWVLTNRAGT